jgi:hypothetical protein
MWFKLHFYPFRCLPFAIDVPLGNAKRLFLIPFHENVYIQGNMKQRILNMTLYINVWYFGNYRWSGGKTVLLEEYCNIVSNFNSSL